MSNQYPAQSARRTYFMLALISLALIALGGVSLYRMYARGQVFYRLHPRLPLSNSQHASSRPPAVKPPVASPTAPVTTPITSNLKPSPSNDLCTAAMNGNFVEVKHLIAKRPTLVNMPDTSEEGAPPLLWALNHHHRDIVDYLLAHGADVNGSGKLLGKNALHIAAFQGDTELALMLLTHHAAINARERDGGTALFIAVGKGHLDTANALLRFHPDVNIAEKSDDWTPLIAAIIGKHTAIVPSLIAHGANINSRTIHDGYTPLVLAKIYDEQNVVAQLKKAGAKH
jgi:ankyrin repeat protein